MENAELVRQIVCASRGGPKPVELEYCVRRATPDRDTISATEERGGWRGGNPVLEPHAEVVEYTHRARYRNAVRVAFVEPKRSQARCKGIRAPIGAAAPQFAEQGEWWRPRRRAHIVRDDTA